jgi:alcohol dehydrogenase class IV
VQFEFVTGEIVFGWGRISELGARSESFGRRVLVVTGSRPARTDRAQDILRSAGATLETLCVDSEPTTTLVRRGVEVARGAKVQWVLGIGGGSALDAAKAIAALAPNPGDLFQYLEVVGQGLALSQPGLPCVAVPTTSGTGSEVTKNAVLHAEEHRVKVSLRGQNLLPRLALVDPELTVSVPANVTASTGLDALTQLIEPYVSVARGPMTDALCLEGMRCAARSLRAVYVDGRNRSAREDMALASLFGGLALANARLGAVHGFAAPIGGFCEAPHGAICARLLPLVMRENLQAVRNANHTELLDRFTVVARTLTGMSAAQADDAIVWLDSLVNDLGIARLGALGVGPQHVDALVRQAQKASSMKGNPVALPAEVLTRILRESL